MYKVLLVEDEEMIRKGLRYSFDWLQYDCIVVGEAENGLDGLSQIRTLQPDIVIVDVNMPLLNGIQMIEQSVEDSSCSYIILSGYDEFHLAKEAIHLGVTEYLLKPLVYEQLIEALERAKQQLEMKRKYDVIQASALDVNEINALLIEMPKKSSFYVSKMIEYVQDHYTDKITIQDIVDKLGMSATYLNRKFKQETTYTFNDFLNRYRMQQAIEKFKNGNMKIYAVALEVGFKDYKYFITIFKKYLNCTPSEFQKRYGFSLEDNEL